MTSLDQATSLLRSRAGLKTEPVSRAKLERLLLEGAERAGIPVEAYVSIVDKQPSAFDDLLDRVTVQHSAFFRDPAQLAALAHLARDTSGSGKSERVVWSAGCGNGQEPYSLAMVLDESGAGDWRVMATDVSFQALARTGEAHYTEREVEGLTGERRRRYLTPSRGGYDVVPSIRNRVRIAHHNLARDGAEPFAGKPDVVFCRNVLMYFEKEEARASIGRIASRMAPGAHLFLGPSDSPGGMAAWFAEVHVAGALCFKRLPGAPAARAMTSRPPAVVPSPHDLAGLLEQGNRAAADGDVRAAVRAFRQATYLDPTVAVAYFQLGAALELAGDTREARRAFAAAGLAMVSGDGTEDVSGLGGYTRRDLATVIAYKLTAREQTS